VSRWRRPLRSATVVGGWLLTACFPFGVAPANTATTAPASAIATGPAGSQTARAGERVTFNDGLAVTIAAAEADVSKRAIWPAEGTRYVAVFLSADNAGSTTIKLDGTQPTAVDDQGTAHGPVASSTRDDRLRLPLDLVAGSSAQGSVLFELPNATTTFSVRFRSVAISLGLPAAARISGRLSYPSDFMPPMSIYAFTMQANSLVAVFRAHTKGGVTTYALEGLAPGRYTVVAYSSFDRTNYLASGYTRAVPCGLQQACTDHALIPVAVRAGDAVPNIDPTDFAPGATGFPPLPGP
jgi:hypothetical protein